jgi:hypothetical protein
MKHFSNLLIFLLFTTTTNAQDIQFHYDFRHSVDPKLNPKNFPMISFQYFKAIDTSSTGSFLLKVQSFLSGEKGNTGQVFFQVSQTLKFWKPKIYLSAGYNGGLGIAPPSYGYYLNNTFGLGAARPFQWKKAFFSTSLLYRYSAFNKASFDPQLTLYIGRGFLNYKLFFEGSFVFFTENRNIGVEYTKHLNGKKFAFYGDPQIWFRVKNNLSAGTRLSVYYHLLNNGNQIQAYPTLGIKYKF